MPLDFLPHRGYISKYGNPTSKTREASPLQRTSGEAPPRTRRPDTRGGRTGRHQPFGLDAGTVDKGSKKGNIRNKKTRGLRTRSMTVDSIIKTAYAQLIGLQGNIPHNVATLEFIEDYHRILDDLEPLSASFDLSKFRVPFDYMYQDDDVSRGIYCHSSYLRSKIDGLLTLFDVSKDKVGFIAPK